MKQTEKIEKFLNWLMDNNYFYYIEWFKNSFDIKDETYASLIDELKQTNSCDFVSMIKSGVTEQNSFEYELMYSSWSDYCNNNMEITDSLYFEDGEYIKYSVIRYGVKTDYIAIIEIFEDDFVSEYCCAVINSEDEDLKGLISYYEKYDIDEYFCGFRLANKNEIKWLNKHLKEYDEVRFNRIKKELEEIK